MDGICLLVLFYGSELHPSGDILLCAHSCAKPNYCTSTLQKCSSDVMVLVQIPLHKQITVIPFSLLVLLPTLVVYSTSDTVLAYDNTMAYGTSACALLDIATAQYCSTIRYSTVLLRMHYCTLYCTLL